MRIMIKNLEITVQACYRFAASYGITMLIIVLLFLPQLGKAQGCGFGSGNGCSNTNYDNSFLKTETYNNPATIEYDNFVSTFHSTLIRTSSGGFKVWGAYIASSGTSSVASPQDLNSTNYTALGTNKIYKVTGASNASVMNNSTDNAEQFVALASDGLYAWSKPGLILDTSIKSTNAFGKISVDGKTDGLPQGVSPSDVKMITSQYQTLIIVTCSGALYTLSQNPSQRGNGSTGSSTVWSQVQTSNGVFLTDIIAARGNGSGAIIALKSDGTLWTLGNSYIGNGTALDNFTWATQMVSPPGTPKMIGASLYTFYVLMTNGNLYSLGNYTSTGDWTTTERTSWVQPRYGSQTGPVMDNISWISPRDNDTFFSGINVLTKTGQLYSWGYNSSYSIGTSPNNNITNPQIPSGVAATDKIIAVETGGHTSMLVKQCSSNFGYVGHRVNGSMGNGTLADAIVSSYSYSTAPVEICSAEPVNLTAANAGPYCSNATLQLSGTPSGGTYSVISGPATVNSTSGLVTFTGAGSPVVRYTSPASCSASPVTKDITLQSVTPPTASITPTNQTINKDATPTTLTATVSPTTGLTYQWYSNISSSNTGGTLIAGATALTYIPPTNTIGTMYYYIVVTNGSCSTASLAAQVNVVCPVASYTPTVNTAVGNNCPATTVNLNTQAHTGTVPANAELRWFGNSSHTGSPVATPTAVGAGDYYAFYYSTVSTCYSPASQKVTVTITACQPCSAADPMPADLATFSPPAGPNGSVTEWHNSATPSNATRLASTTVNATSTATSYWVYYHDTAIDCYSPGSKVTVVSNSCCNYPTVDLTALPQTAPPAGASLVWYTTKTHDSGTKVNNPTAAGNGKYWPFYYDPSYDCFSPAGTPVLVAVDNVCDGACYKPAATGGTVLHTKHGISALGRAGNTTAEWPGARKGAWTVLESKEKGFVVNRVGTAAASGLSSITNPVEGMMVYDVFAGCLKVYTIKQGDISPAWHCMTTPACPD